MSLIELCSFWYGLKDLFTLHNLAEKVSLTTKTDDVTGGRGDVDPSGSVANRFRKKKERPFFFFSILRKHCPFQVYATIKYHEYLFSKQCGRRRKER